RESRRAEPPPELCVEIVLCQQAVRPAVRKREDRGTACFAFGALHPIDDELEGFVPRNPLELALPLGSDPNAWMLEAVGAVHPLAELSDFGADITPRHGVLVRSIDVDDAAALDRDSQTARIGTI